MNIDLKELENLLVLLEQRQIHEFEFEDEKSRLHLKRGQPAALDALVPVRAALGTSAAPSPVAGAAAADTGAAAADANVTFITSPFVGTFYRAPSPEAAHFVDIGTHAKKGQPLCIVEAMKLMNEIEADFACTILECMVDNARPVEFGQKLFKVRKV